MSEHFGAGVHKWLGTHSTGGKPWHPANQLPGTNEVVALGREPTLYQASLRAYQTWLHSEYLFLYQQVPIILTPHQRNFGSSKPQLTKLRSAGAQSQLKQPQCNSCTSDSGSQQSRDRTFGRARETGTLPGGHLSKCQRSYPRKTHRHGCLDMTRTRTTPIGVLTWRGEA